MGLTLGARLNELRDSGEPLQVVFAESEANAIQARLFHELALILGERWDKISDKKRPLYTPEPRYRILRIRRLRALSAGETAHLFRVSPGTISRWESESSGISEDESRKPLVRTGSPVRRYADVVRQLVHSMKLAGFGGYETIAQTLARAGWKLSKRTVRRILREQPPSGSPTEVEATKTSLAVHPRISQPYRLHRHHRMPGLFAFGVSSSPRVCSYKNRRYHPSAGFSRPPPSDSVFRVTDQGSEFTAKDFHYRVNKLGVRHRFGAIGRTGSIALIERLWRTLKQCLALKAFRPLVLDELEQRLPWDSPTTPSSDPIRVSRAQLPPRCASGRTPVSRHAIPPPRGRPGEHVDDPPMQIDYLDPERRLPFLRARPPSNLRNSLLTMSAVGTVLQSVCFLSITNRAIATCGEPHACAQLPLPHYREHCRYPASEPWEKTRRHPATPKRVLESHF